MKAESKYDTRSTEAGYLSSAHQKRLAEIRRDLALCDSFPQRSFDISEDIAVGALITIQAGEVKKTIFLCLFLGGFELEIDNQFIQVVTVHSPFGKELIGLKCNDEFDFVVKGYQRLNLEVFNMANGTKVASKQNLTAGLPIYLGHLSAGTYVIKVSSTDNKISYQFKVVKL
jgi:transcription elongation GreA/GreB family factor